MPTNGRAFISTLTAAALLVASCTGPETTIESSGAPGPAASPSPTISATTTPSCSPRQLTTSFDLPADATLASTTMTNEVFECASRVVVAVPDQNAVGTAAQLALEQSAPLIVADPADASQLAETVATIDRLDARSVTFVGPPSARVPAEWEITEPVAVEDLTALFATDNGGPVWVVPEEHLKVGLAALPSITAAGGRMVLGSQPTGVSFDQVAVVGDLDATQRWQLLSAGHADELPGGGVTLFPGRRIVAYYGSPVTFRLGLLGELSPDQTLAELRALSQEYAIPGGDPVIPGFEIIATVADSKPGDDNDYSNELTPDQMRVWVDLATENDVFVIIDLQPGRTDFLTQAQRYEEFLRLPNVGLALDPEWRLEPDEVHLRQIGSVDAAEVNEVVAWMASLVRHDMLPQKLLVLHQFNLEMITNRELILTPPELAVVVHVDGQGPLGSKYGTYETVLGAPLGAEQALWWGWKNFVDEDFPTAVPSQVNAVEPLPVIVTYQ